MLTLTSPVETWAHRLPAGVKLAALAGTTVLLFRLQAPLTLAAALAVVAGLTATGGALFAAAAARMLRPLWPFVLVILLWHLVLHDLSGGAAIVLRLVAAVGAANLVTMTTRLSDMMAVIGRLAAPLALVGLPPQRLALAVGLVIRFIPVLGARVAAIRSAWAARSPRRPGWRLVAPLTAAALDDAAHVAEALRARGGSV